MRVRQLLGLSAVIAIATLTTVSCRSQSQSQSASQGQASLKTSWGEPDLQGIWDAMPLEIPLQRPAKYKDQEFFTDEQIAELDQRRAAMPGNETRATKGTEQDVAGAYNAVFTSRRPTGRRTSLIVDPPDGRIPPVLPAVQERRAYIRTLQLAFLEATETCKNKLPGCDGGKYTGKVTSRRFEPYKYYPNYRLNKMDGPEDHGAMNTRCLGMGVPGFNGYRQIVQTPGVISIFYDVGQGQGFHRPIAITSRPHLPSHVTTWWGDSVAKWEGDTLVVDVTNFNGKNDFQGSNTENLHLVERWTRTGPDTIEYVVTISDPTTWTKPWTVKQEFKKQSDEANRIYKEPRCADGEYARFAMMNGARVAEKAFAEGKGPNPATINLATPTNSANQLAVEEGEEEGDPFGAGDGGGN
jgi:hypothetical protein